MEETWVISYYVAQDDTWMMQGVLGRGKTRQEVGRLASLWPAIKHVSAVLHSNDLYEDEEWEVIDDVS